MVVLLHAHFADVAVVPPSRHKVLAIEAHLLQILLALLPYKFVVVLDLPSRRPGKQGEVKYEHGGEEDDLWVEGVPLYEGEEDVEEGDVEGEAEEEDERVGVFPAAGFILQLDVAVQFQHVAAGKFLIQHAPDGLEFVLLRHRHRRFVLIVS